MNEQQQNLNKQFHNDETLKFRAHSRAVKQFGFWTAEALGMSGDDAECYAQSLVDIDFDEPGVGNVLCKARKDLSCHGRDVTIERLEEVFDDKYATAKVSVLQEM